MKTCLSSRWLVHVLLSALVVSAPCTSAQGQTSGIVISQIYGGGGNSGATLRNDFVELFNRGSSAVDISGWSVQYASATGSTWDGTPLNGTIQPGRYYLIQEAQGNAGSLSLPPPDAIGGINLSATSGKVALVLNSATLSGPNPTGSNVVDFVGYGRANAAENTPTDVLSNTTAALRRSGGCSDAENNAADFTIDAPSPRNSSSQLHPCSTTLPPSPQITQAGVTNAASFVSGPVAPGEIITIFGSGLGPSALATLQLTPDKQFITTSLANTRVLFDGVASPIIYSLAQQISAIVPYAVAGQSTTAVEVEYNGILSNQIEMPVSTSAPGVFSSLSTGQGQGAVLNQDYTVNGPSHPAPVGSVLIIYATGAGQTSPPGQDGKVIGTDLPKLIQSVTVQIGGMEAEVQYAGPAPGLVSGVLQVNAKIPPNALVGPTVPLVVYVGSAPSQPGITVAIAASSTPGQSEADPIVEQKLKDLKQNAAVPPLPEIPDDRSPIPADWLGLVSWNTQVGGTSPDPTAERPPMVRSALATLFEGTYQILAAQEVPNSESADLLSTLLPGGTARWGMSFFDTTDTMDNGFWYQTGVTRRDSFALFVTDQTDASGRILADNTKALHPPQVAQFEAGDFDFTLITLHLDFADGDASQTVRELRNVLDYVDWYFDQPDHDPDVIVCGDFNLPSKLSGQTASGGITLDSVFDQDPRFQIGERRFVVTVHEPTSRSSAATGGLPVSNYDHCVLSADTMKAFVEARRVSTDILTSSPEDPEARLTSDHFPIVAFFRTKGEGISLDRKTRIRPN